MPDDKDKLNIRVNEKEIVLEIFLRIEFCSPYSKNVDVLLILLCIFIFQIVLLYLKINYHLQNNFCLNRSIFHVQIF